MFGHRQYFNRLRFAPCIAYVAGGFLVCFFLFFFEPQKTKHTKKTDSYAGYPIQGNPNSAESGKFLLVGSKIVGYGNWDSTQAIWNPAGDCSAESNFRWQGIRNPIAGFLNPPGAIQNSSLVSRIKDNANSWTLTYFRTASTHVLQYLWPHAIVCTASLRSPSHLGHKFFLSINDRSAGGKLYPGIMRLKKDKRWWNWGTNLLDVIVFCYFCIYVMIN